MRKITMKKEIIKSLVAICSLTMVLMFVFACGGDDGGSPSSGTNDNSGASGNETLISETTSLSNLTIADGEILVAPDGYSLTMTVDGVETPMEAGTYTGDIALTVTEEILITYRSLDTVYWRTAVYVEDGAYVPVKSVEAAWGGGTVTDTTAMDLSITSVGENFNGFVITGDSDYSYTIEDPIINFTGNGGNDFSGHGAAIVSKGSADVTVNNANIVTTGVVRTTVFVGGDSTMRVNDSYLEVNNGTLPANYVTNTSLGEMKEVPWMLGLTGNCRATNLVDNGTAYYNNTHIKARGWGCLSTDDTETVRLYATDCVIETVESGYGAYSIGDSIVTFEGCTVDVADMAMILANGTAAGVFTSSDSNTTQVTSGRFGVMFHASNNGTLTINNESDFDTDKAVFMIKSASPTIMVEDSTLTSGNGIILQAMNNDDPNMGGSGGTVKITFSDMYDAKALNGDIINGMSGTVNVTLENSTITGAITTSTTAPVGEISQAYYYNISEVTNTYGTTGYGMTVSLDADSEWVVDTDSYLTGLTIANGATVTAPAGKTVTMTVDDVVTPIAAGDYTGKIELTVI
jgi:hypothetical protein